METVPETYHEALKLIIEHTREFLRDGQELAPICFLGKFEAGLVPFPMSFADIEAKNKSAAVVRSLAAKYKVDYLIMISEAWAVAEAENPEAIDKLLKQYGSVQNCSNKVEVVMLTLETRQGVWMSMPLIKRLNDKQRDCEDFKFKQSEAEGRFVHLLPPDILQ